MTDWYLAGYERKPFPVTGAIAPFNVFDQSKSNASITLSNSNLTATSTRGPGVGIFSAALGGALSGKRFCSFTIAHDSIHSGVDALGIADNTFSFTSTGALSGVNGSSTNVGISDLDSSTPFNTGDIVDMAVDFSSYPSILFLWWRVNGGNWNGSPTADPATGAGSINWATMSGTALAYYPIIQVERSPDQMTANFGNLAYPFPQPTGFTNWPAT